MFGPYKSSPEYKHREEHSCKHDFEHNYEYEILDEPLPEGHIKCAECGKIFKRPSRFASRQKWCAECAHQKRLQSHRAYHHRCMQDPERVAKIREYDRIRKYKKYHGKDTKPLVS